MPLIGELEILIKSPSLRLFVKRQLSEYIEESEVSKSIHVNDVLIDVKSNLIIGKNKNQILRCFKFGYADVSVRIVGESSLINISVKKKHRLRELVRYIKDDEYSKIHNDFYRLVLFPILHIYSSVYGLKVCHGGLVETEEGVSVITGMPGSGKSSVLKALGGLGFRIYSDNWILTDGRYYIGLALPTRINSNDECGVDNIIYADPRRKEINLCVKQSNYAELDKYIELHKIDHESKVLIEKSTHITSINESIYSNIFSAPEIVDANLYDLKMRGIFENPFHNQINNKVTERTGFVTNVCIPAGKIKRGVEEICKLITC